MDHQIPRAKRKDLLHPEEVKHHDARFDQPRKHRGDRGTPDPQRREAQFAENQDIVKRDV